MINITDKRSFLIDKRKTTFADKDKKRADILMSTLLFFININDYLHISLIIWISSPPISSASFIV